MLAFVLSAPRRAIPIRDFRVGVLYLGGVGRAGAGVELAQHRIIQRVRLEPGHLAARSVEVPKNNGLGRTGLLTGCPHLSLADAPILFLAGDSGGTDALDTVSAFFHDPTPAHSDFRVVHRFAVRLV